MVLNPPERQVIGEPIDQFVADVGVDAIENAELRPAAADVGHRCAVQMTLMYAILSNVRRLNTTGGSAGHVGETTRALAPVGVNGSSSPREDLRADVLPVDLAI